MMALLAHPAHPHARPMHPLIAPQALAPHLADPAWAVFDCRHALTDAAYGRAAYAAGHVPGARFAAMDADLCGPIGAGTGRHPLPAWDAFCDWLGARGVSAQSTVVAYDDSHGAHAARLWWMLRALGHERVAVLDGGFARWTREGLPTDAAPPAPRPARYAAQPAGALLAGLEELRRSLGAAPLLLVDARAAERYRGDSEPMDPRAGHIPGAVNLPYAGNLAADGTFLPPQALRRRLLGAYGAVPPQQAIHYCGSGVTACHNLLAQAAAGLPMGRLYAGSWSQWCADPARPAELGEAPPRTATAAAR
jgi:thiosulfate/3-mercaptopyruvate sulfurtransferase